MKFIFVLELPMSERFKLLIHQDKLEQLTAYPAICITGTDTGIGKTVVTGLLAKEFARTKKVVTQKWIQSGDLDSPDIKAHDELSGLIIGDEYASDRQVYSFKTPASPHLAASIENTIIQPDQLINATYRLKDAHDIVLVETSGGIMVPLNQTLTVGDVVTQMKLPTIIVVPNKLGTINHTLLTAYYIKQNNIPLLGFIVNNFGKPTTDIEKDNPNIISQIMNLPCLGKVQ